MRLPTTILLIIAPLFLGCFQDSTPEHSNFLPLDYQSTFLTMRTCRMNPGHNNAYEIVLANPIGADAYSSRSVPIPEGTVIITEEHQEASCMSLVGYYLMAKEKAGYDTASGDWHWQKLDINQRIQQDGHLTACSSCHAKPPCTDFLCSLP